MFGSSGLNSPIQPFHGRPADAFQRQRCGGRNGRVSSGRLLTLPLCVKKRDHLFSDRGHHRTSPLVSVDAVGVKCLCTTSARVGAAPGSGPRSATDSVDEARGDRVHYQARQLRQLKVAHAAKFRRLA